MYKSERSRQIFMLFVTTETIKIMSYAVINSWTVSHNKLLYTRPISLIMANLCAV